MSEAINKKETIAVLLKNELSYIYCFNCEKQLDDDRCGDCHRKYMNWSLSMDSALELAEKVLQIVDGKGEE